MLDIHTNEFNYLEISPPLIVNEDVMFGTGQLPKFEEDQFEIKLENSSFIVKNKTKNEITIKVENNFIISSLKTILNNFDIEDLYINEPPVDEIIGKILMKKDYGN